MHMRVRGTQELLTWILGFGRQVTVLEPSLLRDEVANEMREALKTYG